MCIMKTMHFKISNIALFKIRFSVELQSILIFYANNFRNPHFHSAKNMYSWIKWTPQRFQRYCQASQAATPPNSTVSHEARVFAWRNK